MNDISNIKSLKEDLRTTKEKLHEITQQIHLLNEERRKLQSRCKQIESQLTCARISDLNSLTDAHSQYDQPDVFPWSSELHRVLSQMFRIQAFRPLQLKAINAAMDGKDVILVMPTGAGKSLVYQVPAFLNHPAESKLASITLVISPLVSLMADQSMNLYKLGLPEGSIKVFDANTPLSEQKIILDELAGKQHSALRLLYVTPEKLAKSKRLLNRLECLYTTGRLLRIAIDEVHCVSQWGHDFRPDYQFLHVLRRQFPSVPILGLTATASTQVIVDVQSMLNLSPERCLVLRSPCNRKNLFYEVRNCLGPTKQSLDDLYALIRDRYAGKSGIVYCFSQQDTVDVAQDLSRRGLRVGHYHANMESSVRTRTHKEWFEGTILIIVATVAFGMGIDKPDVRFVIHFSSSKSLENYYQESGRAGRDSRPAECVLFWRFGDLFRLAAMVSSERTGLSKLFHMVRYCLDRDTCRRGLIAKHLDDRSSAVEDCSQSCDNCRLRDAGCVLKLDVTHLVERILSFLTTHLAKSQSRVTGPKLIDLLIGHADILAAARDVLPDCKKPPRSFYEHVVAWCVVHGLLKLEFHYTPYSTLCYLVPGTMDLSTSMVVSYYFTEAISGKRRGSTKLDPPPNSVGVADKRSRTSECSGSVPVQL